LNIKSIQNKANTSTMRKVPGLGTLEPGPRIQDTDEDELLPR